MMFKFWKKKHPAKTTAAESTIPGSVQTATTAQTPPLYFFDVDDAGKLFLRFAHVTSSVHEPAIRENGLQPLRDVPKSLLTYLAKVFPDTDANTLLDQIRNDPDGHRSNLVKERLQEQADHGQSMVFLLPLGAKGYLKSASKNAVRDGGEVFMVAREAINKMNGTNAQPQYPDAVPTVFVVRHYLVNGPKQLTLEGIPEETGHEVSLDVLHTVGFQSEHWCTYGLDFQLKTLTPYAPENVERSFSQDDYLSPHLAVGRISPAAAKILEKLCTAAASLPSADE